MKHVFFVHSHITWLVAGGVIRHLGLAAGDVLFVRSRGYVPLSGEYEQIDFPVREARLTFTRDVADWLQERRTLAAFVDGIAQGEFTWYLPHTAFAFFPAFIAHPRCRGFSVIEEGMAAYHTPEGIARVLAMQAAARPTNWRARLVRRLGLARTPVFADERYLAVYGCTEEAFPGYARKVRVAFDAPPAANNEEIATVLVFDAVLEYGLADEAAFFQCLEELVAKLAADGRSTVHFKLHPQQYVDRRYTDRLRETLQANERGVVFRELAADTCLERLAAAGHADFYLFVSSVGIYAAEAGCRVFSMARRLAELDPRYAAVLAAVPERVRF